MKTKMIKDLVHGYIFIDSSIEEIINTDNFQRLRDIRQLTAQQVFPSATHNRFEHSLGVMFLSNKAFFALKQTLLSMGIGESEYNKLHLHLIIASLLHDVGHAPFSHLGEKYFQSKEKLKDEIKKLITSMRLNIPISIFDFGAKHELMSCYVIIKKYHEIIENIFTNKQIPLDMELICRCVVGASYDDYKNPSNIAISLLNSTTIDTDKLDYLMRDAYMTGIDVPSIDTERLFRNITINKDTNEITFYHRALPVIQNIIEARDNMYLWVYNHHITVYTDFVLEYYIKHLILNFEKRRSEDKLDPEKLFSVSAIADKLISDSDLFAALKAPLSGDAPMSESSAYTQRILPQFYSRKFLSPLWKTIYDFSEFMDKNVPVTIRDSTIKQLGEMEDYRMRVAVAKELIDRCELNLGEIFIIPRSNKFYSLNPKNVFTVYIDGKDISIDRLLPQKKYDEMFSEVAFYLFCRKDKKEMVEEQFIDIISKPLNLKLEGISESPKWLL